MVYLFQRIILNNFQWTRPSPGRLGASGEGEYVQKNGFGHEDWNFNNTLLVDGQIFGYCYYRPVESKRNECFSIAFATYTNKQWYLVGFYLKSTFDDDPPADKDVLRQKMRDLRQLGPSLGKAWRDKSDREFLANLNDEAKWLKWCVRPDDAVRLLQPIPIPKKLFNTRNYRITKPTEVEETLFKKLLNLAQSDAAIEDYASDSEFPEGRELEKKHKVRERNQALVKAAKDAFKKRHGHVFCQICGFNFAKQYGEIGTDFIEAHHTVPVSELTEKSMTRVRDIALVCANCHRMLHRRRPWLSMKELKDLAVDYV
ncbi:MAG TPA: HNH endonuclease [Gammaproteobacteria bacterium]